MSIEQTSKNIFHVINILEKEMLAWGDENMKAAKIPAVLLCSAIAESYISFVL